MEKTSEVLSGCMEKIKVSSAEIVVHGIKDKPYYEIKYRDLSDGQIHEGYSSYNLDYVFGWLEECFEIMHEKDADRTSISEQVKELRELANDVWLNSNEKFGIKINQAADTIESLSAKLADMERSAEDCGGWIACKERLPEDEGMYLITAKVLEKIEIQYVFFQKNMDLFICNGIAIAWKPLPEPYHEP